MSVILSECNERRISLRALRDPSAAPQDDEGVMKE